MTPEELVARGIRVKALEWSEGKHLCSVGRALIANCIFGRYEVVTGWQNGKTSAHRSYAETEWLASESDAITLLQADYEARICAALEGVK